MHTKPTDNLTGTSSVWIERLARLGYAAKGLVYAVVGILAAMAAFGAGGKTTDTNGALVTIVAQPFGKFLLGLVAVGLVGYVLWCFVQAIADAENKGKDAKGIVQRLGYAGSGIIYAGLALKAVQILRGSDRGSGSNASQDWTARLLAQPFGQWLVGIVGIAVIGMGFYQFYEAYKAKFRKKIKMNQMNDAEKKWAVYSGRFGIAARGVVFSIIGIFLIQAAHDSNPNRVRGLAGALQALAQQPYGSLILGIVAFGLIAYGIYNLVLARYRQIVPK